jgi:phage terminase large subunit-like protein
MPPRVKAKNMELSKAEVFGLLAEKIKTQATTPNILGYKPHFKQELFHRDTNHTRLYIGGNRSGKTYGGAAEAYYRAKGEHPYQRVPEAPTRGRIVCVDYAQGINQIIIPKLKEIFPPSILKGGSWDRSYHTDSKILSLANGSSIELMSYEQKLDSFAGTSRHWLWCDEEPPKAIYNECNMRLLDTNGFAWITMTPVNGMTWVYDEFFEPVAINEEDIGVGVTIVDVHENPYLEKEAVDRILRGITDPEERKAREKGTFVQMGGVVYKQFDKDVHVVPWDDKLLEHVRACEIYTSMDHGYNAPTAWLWHAVAKDGTVLTFAEHYQAEMIVSDHAKKVLALEKSLQLPEPLIRIADPATQQRQGVTGNSISTEYATEGVYLSPGNNDVLSGVARVQKYLRINPATGKPYRLITDNCPNLIKEMGKLKWATYASSKMRFDHNPQEKIHKKDDHACDSDRYFFNTVMPDIDIEEEVKKPVDRQPFERYDELLAKMGPKDEFKPTIWDTSPGSLTSWEGLD